jgi:hypothetical protein
MTLVRTPSRDSSRTRMVAGIDPEMLRRAKTVSGLYYVISQA